MGLCSGGSAAPAHGPSDLRVALGRHVLAPEAQPDEPPRGSPASPDGTAWHVEHDALEGHDPCFPFLPMVLPVGDDEEGTWLVAARSRATSCPSSARRPRRSGAAARGAAGSWAWSETVLITEDPDDPALRAETAADPSIARTCSSAAIPLRCLPAAVGRCAVVTMDPVAASDLTVLVDRQAATLHPMGLVVRPHLQSPAHGPAHCRTDRAPPARSDADGSEQTSDLGEHGVATAGEGRTLSPGAVDVRLSP